MTDLPEPLVAPEVDLRDFGFMPLDVLRLRDSDLASHPDPEVFRCAVLSWCVAWHQIPAASMPKDDVALARLLGFGRDVKGWQKVRAAGGMRGWIECADGRLYHHVVADKARDAWQSKVAQRARTEAARKAREEARQRLSQQQSQALSQTQKSSVTETVTESKGQGQGQGQGQGIDEIHNPVGLFADEPIGPAQTGPYEPPDCPHAAVLRLWSEVLPALPQHDPQHWDGTRAGHLRSRWRETAVAKRWPDQAAGLAYLRKLFAYVGKSAFLTGRVPPSKPGKRAFVIELEWLVSPGNWSRVHEGKYHEEAA